jgi:hypothetical protein
VRKFENRVLREILEPKSEEVAEDWGNVYNEKVGDFCSSSSTVRRIRPGRPAYVFMVVELGVPREDHKTYSNKIPNRRTWILNIRSNEN